MIRIDEIYSHTFWPWIKQNRPNTRMFYCYPFGRTDTESICSYRPDHGGQLNFIDQQQITVAKLQQHKHLLDNNYTLFFDQEPIDLNRHSATFDLVKHTLNHDINLSWCIHHADRDSWAEIQQATPPATGTIVTSERNSAQVEQICDQLGWRSAYYFFHGWAALDWYRGYDRTYLMAPYQQRQIQQTFLMPNRIIAGEREHRLIMLYHIFRLGMGHNHISCPLQCPAEGIPIDQAVAKLTDRYPDAGAVFDIESFPREFVGEANAPMHSYQLSLFQEAAESLLYLVTETVATGRRLHLTEKTFKPIALKMPFVIVGTQGSLAYLRSYGFRTFGDLWDESYDSEPDDLRRLERIADLLHQLDQLPANQKQQLFAAAHSICDYNYQHFYSGGFERVLWQELESMLHGL